MKTDILCFAIISTLLISVNAQVNVTISAILFFCDDSNCLNPSQSPTVNLTINTPFYMKLTVLDPAFSNLFITNTSITYTNISTLLNTYDASPFVMSSLPGNILFNLTMKTVSTNFVINFLGILSPISYFVPNTTGMNTTSSNSTSTDNTTSNSTTSSNKTDNTSSKSTSPNTSRVLADSNSSTPTDSTKTMNLTNSANSTDSKNSTNSTNSTNTTNTTNVINLSSQSVAFVSDGSPTITPMNSQMNVAIFFLIVALNEW